MAANHFVFRRGPFDTWELAFNSNVHVIGGEYKGFEYLARLISKPRFRMSATELSQCAETLELQHYAHHEDRDVVMDQEYIHSLLQERRKLERWLADREDPIAESNLREINAAIKRGLQPNGRSRTLGSTAEKRACQRVQKAITRSLEKLRAFGLNELAAHLASCARPDDGKFVYRDENPPNWDVSWLLPSPCISAKPE